MMTITATPEAQKKASRLEEVIANLSMAARQTVSAIKDQDSYEMDLARATLAQVRELEKMLDNAVVEVELI